MNYFQQLLFNIQETISHRYKILDWTIGKTQRTFSILINDRKLIEISISGNLI